MTTHFGRRAAGLDPKAGKLTLDDGTALEYDDLLIATGSSAVRAPVPGADGPGVHSFWTLEQARGVVAEIRPGSHVVMVGAGFIAFTILNSILALGARLTIVEIAPQILPRMIDRQGASLVDAWLRKHGVEIRTGATLSAVEQHAGRRRLRFKDGEDLDADVVIMATGIRTNLGWLDGSGIRVNRGVVVDDHLRSSVPNVYAAGDVAEGRDLVTGQPDVHAIEPTAMEHGRVVGRQHGGPRRRLPRQPAHEHRGGLPPRRGELRRAGTTRRAEVMLAVDPDRPAYRKLLWHGDRLTGAMILGPSADIWTTNDVGMLKGLVQSGVGARGLEGAAPAEPLRRQARLRRLARDPAAPARRPCSGSRPRRPPCSGARGRTLTSKQFDPDQSAWTPMSAEMFRSQSLTPGEL